MEIYNVNQWDFGFQFDWNQLEWDLTEFDEV